VAFCNILRHSESLTFDRRCRASPRIICIDRQQALLCSERSAGPPPGKYRFMDRGQTYGRCIDRGYIYIRISRRVVVQPLLPLSSYHHSFVVPLSAVPILIRMVVHEIIDPYNLTITLLITIAWQCIGFAIAWTLQVSCASSSAEQHESQGSELNICSLTRSLSE